MNSQKLQVKFFLAASDLHLDDVIPVFHRWIRDHILPELVIDVADYQHVFEGPGVVLVGDAVDYFLDQGEGRLGLLYSRKRQAPAPETRLQDGFRRALNACRLLEADTSFKQPLSFKTDEVVVRVPDRLIAPNDDATYASFSAELDAFIGHIYAGASHSISRIEAEKGPLAARVRIQNAPNVATLLDRLGGPPTTA